MFDKKTINLRKATVKDKIKIAKLHHTMWKSITGSFVDELFFDKIACSFFIDKWKNWLTEKNKITLLAEKNKVLLGFITFEIQSSKSPEIQSIYVAHKHRFSNLQRLLFEAVVKMVTELGFIKIYFSIAKGNKKDLLLYKLIKGYSSEEEIIKPIFGFNFLEIRYEFDLN